MAGAGERRLFYRRVSSELFNSIARFASSPQPGQSTAPPAHAACTTAASSQTVGLDWRLRCAAVQSAPPRAARRRRTPPGPSADRLARPMRPVHCPATPFCHAFLPLGHCSSLRTLPAQRWQPLARPAPALRQRRQNAAGTCRAAAGAPVDVETARKLIDGTAMVLDIRQGLLHSSAPACAGTRQIVPCLLLASDPCRLSCLPGPSPPLLPCARAAALSRPAADFEEGRITKPPRRTVGVPYTPGQDGAAFVAQVAGKLPNKAAKVIVVRLRCSVGCSAGCSVDAQFGVCCDAPACSRLWQQRRKGLAPAACVTSPCTPLTLPPRCAPTAARRRQRQQSCWRRRGTQQWRRWRAGSAATRRCIWICNLHLSL